MWWVVWISASDSKFHYTKGWDESTASKTAGVLVQRKAMRETDTDELVSLRTLARIVHEGKGIYIDYSTPNPLYCAIQAWVLEAPSYKGAVHIARKAWRATQLKGESNESKGL